VSKFASALVEWQKKHGRRDLPWQGTRDPYRIWLSEVMLQQTQVAAVDRPTPGRFSISWAVFGNPRCTIAFAAA